MAKETGISWCDSTFNPWLGCSKVSAGCAHCYAETLEKRWDRGWGPGVPRRRTSATYWKQPIKWNKEAGAAGQRSRVFCASMADVGEDLPELVEARRDLSIIIENTPHLDWLLLTKRPENLVRLFARWNGAGGWPVNVWAGTSVEDQAAADQRIPALMQVPASTRFLSCEPLIAKVDITNRGIKNGYSVPTQTDAEGRGIEWTDPGDSYVGVDWVIAGGESGAYAREMNPDWARAIRDQCAGSGRTAFFMKQMGGVHDKRGDLEALPKDLRVRQFPA
jgi:protein gp37